MLCSTRRNQTAQAGKSRGGIRDMVKGPLFDLGAIVATPGALEALLDDKPLTVEQMGAIDELGFSDCMSSPIQIASIEPDPGE